MDNSSVTDIATIAKASVTTLNQCTSGTDNCYEGINISALLCNKEAMEGEDPNGYRLSKLCYYATDIDSTNCFPKTYFTTETTDYNIQLFASLWLLFTMIVGGCGNLLTIFAIPYSVLRKRLDKIRYLTLNELRLFTFNIY